MEGLPLVKSPYDTGYETDRYYCPHGLFKSGTAASTVSCNCSWLYFPQVDSVVNNNY